MKGKSFYLVELALTIIIFVIVVQFIYTIDIFINGKSVKVENVNCYASEKVSVKNNENKIDLNNATIDDLMTLPGIKDKKAMSIIEARDELGRFESIEQLKEIKGIGEITFQKIKDFVYIG